MVVMIDLLLIYHQKPSVPSRKEKLSGLAESDKALNEELDTLLPKAPTTTIR